MAKPTWLTIIPTSGSGDAQVQFSAIASLARDPRNYDATIVNNKGDNCVVKISQAGFAAAGANDWVEIQSTAAVEKNGGNVTINGRANASALTFSFKAGGTANIELPANYRVNTIATPNGSAIEGDPGAKDAYDFAIPLVVPANTLLEALTSTLVVTGAGGATAQCAITVAAADPYLYVGAEGQTEITVSIPQHGTAQTIQVLSNDSWSVE